MEEDDLEVRRVLERRTDLSTSKRGKIYSLYSLISKLREMGLESEELGLVYVSSVLNLPPNCYYPLGASESVSRGFKKSFEEEIRTRFYQLGQDLVLSDTDFSTQRSFYERDLQDRLSKPFKFSGVIESKLSNLSKRPIIPLDRVANLLDEGAKKFYHEVYQQCRDPRFLEYNYIARAFRKL